MTEKEQDMQEAEHFTQDQINEIEEGKAAGVDVSVYSKPAFYAIQMRQIRLGLQEGLPVQSYAKPEYDWFQMEEIRKGLREGIDIGIYASPEIPYEKMRQLRKGLKTGVDLSKYLQLDAGILRQLRKALVSRVNIVGYIREGYEPEQLEQIRLAMEKGVDIAPYLVKEFRGASIAEIRQGLEEGLDVSSYAKPEYSWQQMREMRLGLEDRVAISLYAKPLYSWQQMKEIRLGVESGLDVSSYCSLMWTASDMRKKRLALLAGGMPGPQQEEVPAELLDVLDGKPDGPEEFADFTVSISQDEMEAYVEIRGNCVSLRREEIERALKQNGVCAGIRAEAVDSLAAGKEFRRPVLVAQGRKAVNGADGWYEYFFRTEEERKPLLLEDGSVDYQNTQWFELVEHGQKVACYHEAEAGTFGYTVTGRALPANRGKEQKILVGKGFMLLPDNKTYLAATDGKVELKGNRLEISKMLVLNDTTLVTGKVEFDGCVYIKGNVGSGVLIKASEDVIVDGYVESAHIESGGSIILRQGMNAAGNGSLRAGKNIVGKFFEAVRVYAPESIQANYCLNSELYTEGKVTVSGANGSLVGGTVCAVRGLTAYNVGNRAGIATWLKLGVNEILLKKQRALEMQIEEVNKELRILQNAYVDFRTKYPPEVRQSMKIYLKIESAIFTKEKQMDTLCHEKMDLEERFQKVRDAKAVISGSCCEGVVMEISGLRWNARNIQNVTVQRIGNRIAVFEN